jgi:hypothetical protein
MQIPDRERRVQCNGYPLGKARSSNGEFAKAAPWKLRTDAVRGWASEHEADTIHLRAGIRRFRLLPWVRHPRLSAHDSGGR